MGKEPHKPSAVWTHARDLSCLTPRAFSIILVPDGRKQPHFLMLSLSLRHACLPILQAQVSPSLWAPPRVLPACLGTRETWWLLEAAALSRVFWGWEPPAGLLTRSCFVRRSLLCGGLSGCWRGVASHSTLDSSLGLSGKEGPPPQAPTLSSWLLDLIITSWGVFWCCRLWRDRGMRPLTRLPGTPTPLWMHLLPWARI